MKLSHIWRARKSLCKLTITTCILIFLLILDPVLVRSRLMEKKNFSDFDELLELSQRGANRTIDMLVGDIYGGMDYSKIGLSASTIASSFGKTISENKELEHDVYSLERAYQIVQELERYMKTPTSINHFEDQNPEFRPSSSRTAPFLFSNSSSKGRGSTKCYKCLGEGHYAGQCPTKERPRSLLATSTGQEPREELEEEVYVPEIPAL